MSRIWARQGRAYPNPNEFMDLFAPEELDAICAAAATSPALLQWLLRAVGTNAIEPDNQRTRAGMAALVAAGLLSAERATEILAALAPAAE